MPVLKNKEEWAYLTGEDRLGDWLRHHYGLALTSVEPIGGILKLKTDQGFFVLKRVRMGDKERWQQIAKLADFLSKQEGLPFMMPSPVMTERKKPVFDGYRYPYVLLPWIEGMIPPFIQAEEWKDFSKCMASFHVATTPFPVDKMPEKWKRIGNWRAWWESVYNQMEIFHLAANWTSVPTEMDKSWLQISSYSLGLMENLLEYFDKTGGGKLCLDTAEYGKVSHGRWHRKNLLTRPDGSFALLDWNETISDVRAADLADWLLYAYGRTRSRKVMKIILSGYQEVSTLTEADYTLIYARLLYPGPLVRHLQHVYLNDRKPHDAIMGHIQKAIRLEEKKTDLLRDYAQLVREDFHESLPEIDWIRKKGNQA